MTVIHVCDRCGQQRQWPYAGRTKNDPLGQQGASMEDLQGRCEGCRDEAKKIRNQIDDWREQCLVAFDRQQPFPPAPALGYLPENTVIIPADTVVKLDGIPCWLVSDTIVFSAHYAENPGALQSAIIRRSQPRGWTQTADGGDQ